MSEKGILSRCADRGHEQVVFFNYPEVGLKLIVGIHDTTLGPALGGCRMRIYQHEDQAFEDVLRLSEGMTYKSALAGLPLGGGKSCLIADPKLSVGREALFEKVGECLNHLNGRYITAEDMGTSVADMMSIRKRSRFVVGTDKSSGGVGDPSPWTALGVFHAMKAAAERAFPDPSGISGKRIAVQGVGHVGMYLVEHLVKAGASVTVTDTNPALVDEATRKFGVASVAPEAIYDAECDIFAPCAVGQTINPSTLPRLKCKVIAGAANNQLSDAGVYKILRERAILYCPDFAINSGGVICVAAELSTDKSASSWVQQRVEAIYTTTANILDESRSTGRETEVIAYELAKRRIAAAKRP